MNERVEDQTEQPAPTPVVANDWRERVEVEYRELTEKMCKLGAFLDKVEKGEEKIDPVTQGLLIAQHGAMSAYQAILFIRLSTMVQQVEAPTA
jgi:hypothetical protein